MNYNRRKFIKVLWTSSLIFAVDIPLSGCNQMPKKAILPWQPTKHEDVRISILSYAILAPNPHNRQPWIVDLSIPEHIFLYCDSDRLLPETDPFSRQIFIGHGTFLEFLDVAASSLGYETKIDYFPEGEFDPKDVIDRPVAKIRLISAPERKKDPLFDTILSRRSTKEPFSETPLLDAHKNKLQLELNRSPFKSTVLTNSSLIKPLRELTLEAFKIEVYTPHTYQESIDLMRMGSDEVEANPDGIDLLGAFNWWGQTFGLLNRESLVDPNSTAYKMGIDIYTEMLLSVHSFAWITSSQNNRTTQVKVGRTYARLDLTAAQLGVKIHPVSQVLQEYSEMQGLQKKFLEMLQIPNGDTVQMLVRLGFAELPSPAPRHPVQSFIKV